MDLTNLQIAARQPAVQDLVGGLQEFMQGAQQIRSGIEQSQRSGQPYCMQLPQNQGRICYVPPNYSGVPQQ